MADIIELVYADHDWLRRQFFRLDDAKTDEELAAIWDLLGTRLDAHADAEETVFYPALLKHGGRDVRGNPEGDPEDETEDAITDHNAIREAMPDFIKSASLELRHELGMQWLRFYAERESITGIDESSKDADAYIEQHSP